MSTSPLVGQMVFTMGLGIVFVHFTFAGAKTFIIKAGPDTGPGYGQASLYSGVLVTLYEGVYHRLDFGWGVLASVLVLCAVTFYEWARRSIQGYGFSVGLSGRVPDSVFDGGPYAYVRHPIYLSYIIAFAAIPLAWHGIPAFAVFVVNAAFYVYLSFDDERSLASSPLAADYAVYKSRIGRFVPRLRLAHSNPADMPQTNMPQKPPEPPTGF